jgi:hypothetical protein
MPFNKNHTEDECDKCLKKVGKNNLIKLPFLYLDKNDNVHEDVSDSLRQQGFQCDDGYRQYYACKNCAKNEER